MAFELPALPYPVTPSSRTSMRARWRSTTASTTPPTRTTSTPPSRAPGAAGSQRSRSCCAASTRSRATSRRPCATTAAATPTTTCSGRSCRPNGGGRPAASSPTAIDAAFGSFDAFKEKPSPTPRQALRLRLGVAGRRRRRRAAGLLDRQPGLAVHVGPHARSSAWTCGSTPTTCTTRTAGPTTSRRSGTSSTGARWPSSTGREGLIPADRDDDPHRLGDDRGGPHAGPPRSRSVGEVDERARTHRVRVGAGRLPAAGGGGRLGALAARAGRGRRACAATSPRTSRGGSPRRAATSLPWGSRVADLVARGGRPPGRRRSHAGRVGGAAHRRRLDRRAARSDAAGDHRIDVNAASERLLATLPGVGPVMAARIVAARPFHVGRRPPRGRPASAPSAWRRCGRGSPSGAAVDADPVAVGRRRRRGRRGGGRRRGAGVAVPAALVAVVLAAVRRCVRRGAGRRRRGAPRVARVRRRPRRSGAWRAHAWAPRPMPGPAAPARTSSSTRA
jgi:hypothetical protein